MRLTTMVRYAADLPIDVIEAQIASALDCIVQIARAADGRRFVRDVVEVSYDRGAGQCKLNDLYRWDYADDAGRWVSAPRWFDELRYRNLATAQEVEEWLRESCLSA